MNRIKKILKIAGISLIALLIVFFIVSLFVEDSTEKVWRERQEEVAERRKNQKQEFLKEKKVILSNIQNLFDQKKYMETIKEVDKYRQYEDLDFKNIKKRAKTILILNELKDISAREYKKNLDRYKELNELNPDNKKYKEKYYYYRHIYYETELQKKEQREKEKKRKNLINSQFSSWDGSHKKLKKLVKSTMNDPGSFKHVETRYLDKGDYLIVTMSFRGKNVFGGYVKNMIRAKIDLEGNIINILETYP